MNYDTNSSINSHQPVTVLITRSPRQENQKEFEQALSDTKLSNIDIA